VRILSPVTGNGHLSAHADCIKRGFGWHPFRDLLASSSDHISSSPSFASPTSFKTSPFFGSLLYFSSTALLFVYLRVLINACSVWFQPSPSRTRVFLDPLWPLLTIFPINRLVLYSIFFSLLLSHASSVFVLITAALSTFLFTAASVHLTAWATMRKTWEGNSRGMPRLLSSPFRFFLHSCITILN
jgi:hypothetical protein